MQSEVNIKYVLGLEEKQDKTLQMVQIDIPQSSVIIEELEAMQENPNRNLYDMSSYFYRHVNPIKDCYHYCFPEEYQYSFLNEKVTPVPKDITYWKYREVEDEKRKTWARWQLRKKDVPQSEIEKRWNEYVHKLEYPAKEHLYLWQRSKYSARIFKRQSRRQKEILILGCTLVTCWEKHRKQPLKPFWVT